MNQNKYLEKIASWVKEAEDKPKNLDKAKVKKQYNAFLEKFDLRPEQVWLGAGSALVMHGARDKTNDLDAGCDTHTFSAVEKAAKRSREVHGKAEGYLNDNTHILKFPEFNLDLHLEKNTQGVDTEMVNGVHVHSLESVQRQKSSLNRPKDQKDLENIKKLLHGRAKKDVKRQAELETLAQPKEKPKAKKK